ncbi:Microtubule-actin cross-linking factor 1, isoforms 1/2/3/5 620 kDa actin-binding protein [Triplophysa tibetana]|uniref:Microtubule-actin cross-linking factor 1, isoforms 1/2/3/5 620 kDa actin-binding protein n=1 Tax=Triplophysa tibetana TaxID=1572043 RepID=A0A5A9NL59_9TELE|nr:Microtubule-actin cross-linking factor 1, isoforms 1/2/3/5 620 kDa actin-binding protein [Triplophysa tibetana]
MIAPLLFVAAHLLTAAGVWLYRRRKNARRAVYLSGNAHLSGLFDFPSLSSCLSLFIVQRVAGGEHRTTISSKIQGIWNNRVNAVRKYSGIREKDGIDERDRVQKKTFTKWVNKHLIKIMGAKNSGYSKGRAGDQPQKYRSYEGRDSDLITLKVRKHITDLYEDLRDGHNLISLLEVLSGVTLPREKGRMRFHQLQNVQIALDFLKQRQVKLVNIRNDDITDGNPKLTLGLIWTIILHFQSITGARIKCQIGYFLALLGWQLKAIRLVCLYVVLRAHQASEQEQAGGREDEHMDRRREKESEKGGGREREEEEAKAAVEYSVRLQQTRDKALFSASACQREQRSYPATEREDTGNLLLPEPLVFSVTRRPLQSQTGYEDQNDFNVRFRIAEPCKRTLKHTFCSHPVVVQRGAPCQSDQFSHVRLMELRFF